ncbi:MAG: LPXTG cell wall anchor domain-containing protein [Thermoleophilia bacterium]|jgi:LPXTG-motif cell wall-anchored protein
MRKFIKNCTVTIAVVGMMGIMTSSAMAAVPGNSAAHMQDQTKKIQIGPVYHEDIHVFDEGLFHCVVGSECDFETAGDPTVAEDYPVEPDDPSEDDGGAVLGDPPVKPETPSIMKVPDVPERTTVDIPEQPPLRTLETTPPPGNSRLPNTGSSLVLLAGIGALLMAGAFGMKMMVARGHTEAE